MASDDHTTPPEGFELPADAAVDAASPPANGFGAPVEFVDHAPEPDEADEITADRARRWTSQVILCAVVILAFLNAASIRTWSTTLPPDWSTETIRQLANVWTDRIAVAGFDAPRDNIRAAWQGARAVQWGKHAEPAPAPAPAAPDQTTPQP